VKVVAPVTASAEEQGEESGCPYSDGRAASLCADIGGLFGVGDGLVEVAQTAEHGGTELRHWGEHADTRVGHSHVSLDRSQFLEQRSGDVLVLEVERCLTEGGQGGQPGDAHGVRRERLG
jgi:hypothetical protein